MELAHDLLYGWAYPVTWVPRDQNAQPTAHHFGSVSTHVHGAPKLSEHLAGQQSLGDKVVALDQVGCQTVNFGNRGDNNVTCYVMVGNISEQVNSIYISIQCPWLLICQQQHKCCLPICKWLLKELHHWLLTLQQALKVNS